MMLIFTVFFPILVSIFSVIIGKFSKKTRNIFAICVTALVMIALVVSHGVEKNIIGFKLCGFELSFTNSSLHFVLSLMASYIWLITCIFSYEYFEKYINCSRYYMFMLITLGATLGVFLSADFLTGFLFFEIMSFTSFVMVIHDESDLAIYAAKTYLAVAVIGGLITLMGLMMFYYRYGTLNYADIFDIIASKGDKNFVYKCGLLILTGFAFKAGMFPGHIWLPQAHPVAPAPASALLSSVLTKTGIFGVLMLTINLFVDNSLWGFSILIPGTITMVLGAVLALFSIDLKRTLACSSLSQIGFILVGISMQALLGEHNTLAVAGTVLHIVNHGMLKLVLFCSAGVIYMNMHKLDLNILKGYGRNKHVLKLIFLIGTLGICGIPLFNGYVSKTLIHESIVEYIEIVDINIKGIIKFVEYLFLFSGGLTIAYMTKIFVAVFIDKNDNQNLMNSKKSMNFVNKLVLSVSAFILLAFGMFPHHTLEKIAAFSFQSFHTHGAMHPINYFSFTNLKGGAVSIVIGAVVYLLIVRKFMIKDGKYVDLWPKWINIEKYLYRPIVLIILPFVGKTVTVTLELLISKIEVFLPFFGCMIARVLGSLTNYFVVLLRKAVFNQKDKIVIPKEREYIFIAPLNSDKTEMINLSKSMLFFGVGLAFIVLYIVSNWLML